MDRFENISVLDAKKLIDDGHVNLVDIRDIDSFNTSHIEGAIHLTNDNLQEFIQDSDPDCPLIVYCFHGHSSQPAAQLLIDRGFEEVYSLIGGYENWKDAIHRC